MFLQRSSSGASALFEAAVEHRTTEPALGSSLAILAHRQRSNLLLPAGDLRFLTDTRSEGRKLITLDWRIAVRVALARRRSFSTMELPGSNPVRLGQEDSRMAIRATHWERRDGADREALGNAAYDFCRASRAVQGMNNSRFYWTNTDTVVILGDAESPEVFDRPGTPELGKAVFALADLAHQIRDERWVEPRSGQEAYRQAGR